MIFDDLVNNLKDKQSDLKTKNASYTRCFLKDDPRDLLMDSCGIILMKVASRVPLSNICENVGRQLRIRKGLEPDVVRSIHAGWFVVQAYVDLDILEINYEKSVKKSRKSQYRTYMISVKNPDKLMEIIHMSLEEKEERERSALPSFSSPAPWEDFFHPSGIPAIKDLGSKKDIDTRMYEESKEYLFEVLNRLCMRPWRINQRVLRMYNFYLTDVSEDNPHKHMRMAVEHDFEKTVFESLKLRSKFISMVAGMFKDKPFYQMYNLDFRGRIYPTTAYLNEQSSEDAKALLLFHEGKVLTEEGARWLMIHGANCLGLDNLPLNARVEEIRQKESWIVDMARDPFRNKDWMEAEKPFSFLAFCFEFEGYLSNPGTFVSRLPVYIDASCNGSQHLSALSRDKEIARMVNIIPGDRPGDLYTFIAAKVWERLAKEEKELPVMAREMFPMIWKKGLMLRRDLERISKTGSKEGIEEKLNELLEFRKQYKDIRAAVYSVYWNKIKDPKLRRKIVKRPTMTLAYGGTKHGFGTQILEDIRGEDDYTRHMESVWAYKLGALIYDVCHEELKGPGRLLRLFQTIAEENNDRKRNARWKVPVTNFVVFQNYRIPHLGRLKLIHHNRILKIRYQDWTKDSLSMRRQKSALAPNVIHSLDAVHMAMVIKNADYQVAGVHDSYASLAEDCPQLMKDVRQLFVDLYDHDPLKYLLNQFGFIHKMPPRGDLDIEVIKDSEFAFS